MDLQASNITDVVFFTFKQMIGDNGTLIAIENAKDIPFSISRIFYVFGAPQDETRGKHAHKIINQVLICLSGKTKVSVNDGKNLKEFILDSPNKAIFIPNGIWSTQEYSKEAVLLVLCDGPYSENEYVRDWDEFKNLKK